MTNLTAVAIDNQVKLLSNYSNVVLTLLVPRGNIQRMKDLTGCKIIAKESFKATFNHHAGELFNVTISVNWAKISGYFKQTTSAYSCINAAEYANILGVLKFELNFAYLQVVDCSKIPLYAFGKPHLRVKACANNGVYKNLKGEKISLLNQFARFTKFKGTWYSLVETK
jgi:hypothetical protein